MRIGQCKIGLLCLGLLLCSASQSAAETKPSLPDRTRQFLDQLSLTLGLPARQVMHHPKPNAAGPRRLRFNIPFITAPPITGPLSFVRALDADIDEITTYQQLFDWVTEKGTAQQKKNFEKIYSDLHRHFRTQGYNQVQSAQLTQNTISGRLHIYLPLVRRNAPDLSGIEALNQQKGGTGISATDYYNLGLLCQKVGNYKEAARLYQKAVSGGHAMAQASLGFLFETGQGVPRDLEKAMGLYHRSAKQGHSVAQFNLGRIYQYGLKHGAQEIKPDAKQAELFLKRAAAQGIVAAHHQLGLFYLTAGNSIQQQLNQASRAQIAEWHTNKQAIASWDKNTDNRISPDENQQYQVAQAAFVNAAKQEHGPAQHALGVMHLQGMGTPANATAAAQWLAKAAQHQVPEALYNLAQLYEHGIGVRPNLTHAFTLYDQAAHLGRPPIQPGQPDRLGHPPSQYNLGLFYYQGRDAGTRLSVEVPAAFHEKHPANKLPGELLQLDPGKNAFLGNAVALYRPMYGSESWTLKLLVPKGQGENAQKVLENFLQTQGLNPVKPVAIEQLGGYDPKKAFVWWKLAADQKQAAAITGLELLRRVLTPDQVREAEQEAKQLAGEIEGNKQLPPNPMVQAKARSPFKASDWSTGFFVSPDGYVIAGKHLLHSGNKFQVVTENGVFPARVVPLPGDLDQFLLLKVDGDYTFPVLSLNASHGTRQHDRAHVLGYQLPHENLSLFPRAARADTTIASVLGAQADPRFFTLAQPVLGDQLLLKFLHYLDDDQHPAAATVLNATKEEVFALNGHDLRAVQSITRERLRGVLRARHMLLSNAHISVGYRLKTDYWYDEVQRAWLPTNRNGRARKHDGGSWVEIDGRQVHTAPPPAAVHEGQALIRLSIVPGMVQRTTRDVPLEVQAALNVPPAKRTDEHWKAIRGHIVRLFQLAEEMLKPDRRVTSPSTAMDSFLKKAQYQVITRTPGFRGSALLNRQGQAVGLFYPTYRGRSPDVFKNFSSYHQHVLKSDHLKAFLDRLPDVKYTTARAPLPRRGPGGSSIDPEAYWLAKAKSSMVLIQVTGEMKTQLQAAAKGAAP